MPVFLWDDMQKDILHDGDYWLFHDGKLLIAHEKRKDANGQRTVDAFRNLENYNLGKVDFQNLKVFID